MNKGSKHGVCVATAVTIGLLFQLNGKTFDSLLSPRQDYLHFKVGKYLVVREPNT